MAYHALVAAHAQRTRHTHGSTHAKSSEAPTEKPAASACVSAGAHAQRLEPHQEEHAGIRAATHRWVRRLYGARDGSADAGATAPAAPRL